MRRVGGGLALGVLTLALLGPAAPGTAAPTAQDPARGYEIYVRIGCYECHGYAGQGAAATGPRIAPNPIAFNRFVDIIYNPLDVMPRYSPEYVSEDDLRDIYAYLQSIPRSPSPDEIPLLNQ